MAPLADGLGVVGTVPVVPAGQMVQRADGAAAVVVVAAVAHVAAAALKRVAPMEATVREGGPSLVATDGRAACVARGDTALRSHQPWSTGATAPCNRPAVGVAFASGLSHCHYPTRCHPQPLRSRLGFWSARTRALRSGSPGGTVPLRRLQRRSHRGPRHIPAVQRCDNVQRCDKQRARPHADCAVSSEASLHCREPAPGFWVGLGVGRRVRARVRARVWATLCLPRSKSSTTACIPFSSACCVRPVMVTVVPIG